MKYIGKLIMAPYEHNHPYEKPLLGIIIGKEVGKYAYKVYWLDDFENNLSPSEVNNFHQRYLDYRKAEGI